MTANKVGPRASASTPTYHVDDSNGNHIVLRQVGATLRIGTAADYVDLTRQNVIDLLPALTAFSTSGILT
jgi:hypothetical protein